jgi:hypothetical protein
MTRFASKIVKEEWEQILDEAKSVGKEEGKRNALSYPLAEAIDLANEKHLFEAETFDKERWEDWLYNEVYEGLQNTCQYTDNYSDEAADTVRQFMNEQVPNFSEDEKDAYQEIEDELVRELMEVYEEAYCDEAVSYLLDDFELVFQGYKKGILKTLAGGRK